MHSTILSKLLVGLLSLAIASSCSYSSNKPSVAVSTPEPDIIGVDIVRVFERFNAKDYTLFNNAVDDLLQISERSPEARKRVTEKLLKIAVKCKNYREESHEYPVWSMAVTTLGKMESEESIISLCECIDYTNGVGGLGFRRGFPAAYALQLIGRPAIAQLKEIIVSENSNNRANSGLAVSVLGMIGGKEEITFLKNLLKTEKDKFARREIEWALEHIEEVGEAN